MKKPIKVIEISTVEGRSTRLCRFSRGTLALARSTGAASLRWQQSPSQQIQIRQREGREQAHRILRQPAVANFAKAPQALDHMENMFDTGSSGGAATVDEPLVLAQARGTPVDPVADTLSQSGLT